MIVEIGYNCLIDNFSINILFYNNNILTNITKSPKKNIQSKKLNEIYKTFETSYSHQRDKKKLLNSLVQFKEKNHILKEI
jgi:hypothetical protein